MSLPFRPAAPARKSDPGAVSDDAVARLSYQIWEREGRPQGRAREHWQRARLELEAERIRRRPAEAPREYYFWDHNG